MHADIEVEGSKSIGSLLGTLRRYWWVVAGVVWLALLGAVMSTLTTPTSYVGRSSLIVSSNDRSPDQDAVLVQGYAAYFDNVPYQQQLLAEAHLDSSVKIAAETAAASPILVVTATSADPTAAQANAVAVASAFSTDINAVHSRETAAALATAQDQLDTALARNSKQDQAVIAALQDRIRQLQADQVNVLQELQAQGGVAIQSPSWSTNLGLALAGGLLLGVLAALALASVSQRVRTRHDVAQKVGLPTLVELPGAGRRGGQLRRQQLLRQLANVTRARLGGPGVVMVTSATTDRATAWVARSLATEWARQGFYTVLVRLSGSAGLLTPDVEAVQTGSTGDTAGGLRPGPVPNLFVVNTTSPFAGGQVGLPPARITELLETLGDAYVLFEAPGVNASAAAQVAATAADVSILVIDPETSRVDETREAAELLRSSGASLTGAVLGTASDSHDQEAENPWLRGSDGWQDSPDDDQVAWSWSDSPIAADDLADGNVAASQEVVPAGEDDRAGTNGWRRARTGEA